MSSLFSWNAVLESRQAGWNIWWHYLHDSSKMSSGCIKVDILATCIFGKKEALRQVSIKPRYALSCRFALGITFLRRLLSYLYFLFRILSRTDLAISTTCLSANKSRFGSAHIFCFLSLFLFLVLLMLMAPLLSHRWATATTSRKVTYVLLPNICGKVIYCIFI